MLVVDIITIRGAMHSKILFVKINRVFTSGNGEIDIDQGGN